MIARRQNFQRVYDLRERILPGWDDGRRANVPGHEEDVQQLLALRAVQALGVALPPGCPTTTACPRQAIPGAAGSAGGGRPACGGCRSRACLARRISIRFGARPGARHFTTLLSPFDPIVWDRQRLKELFNFDYTIEFYTPAAQAPLRLFHPAHPAPRRARRAAGSQGAPAQGFRGQSPRPGAGCGGDRRAGGVAAGLPAAWQPGTGTPELVIGRVEPEGLGKRLLG